MRGRQTESWKQEMSACVQERALFPAIAAVLPLCLLVCHWPSQGIHACFGVIWYTSKCGRTLVVRCNRLTTRSSTGIAGSRVCMRNQYFCTRSPSSPRVKTIKRQRGIVSIIARAGSNRDEHHTYTGKHSMIEAGQVEKGT